ncbi:hypothetical protein GGQ88_002058 [Novosphingobium hassiacum]|uniref:Uncharacterized protein n=1 Tax=Novosphingobium hassiacum TaxID=173676 RepID=A0A7W5ZYB3_9SPHN|nr:hypothetical protein [Novosphingobium hassiacum]MBB3860789.1 hypothetical protein [Novosphingobium hassiacum]
MNVFLSRKQKKPAAICESGLVARERKQQPTATNSVAGDDSSAQMATQSAKVKGKCRIMDTLPLRVGQVREALFAPTENFPRSINETVLNELTKVFHETRTRVVIPPNIHNPHMP